MTDLIARLEAATEGSRELDIALHKLTSGLRSLKDDPNWIDSSCGRGGGTWEGRSPMYTTSIDAALTLVPEGWGGILGLGKSGVTWLWKSGRGQDEGAKAGNKQPPALALCIAALKARQEDDHG